MVQQGVRESGWEWLSLRGLCCFGWCCCGAPGAVHAWDGTRRPGQEGSTASPHWPKPPKYSEASSEASLLSALPPPAGPGAGPMALALYRRAAEQGNMDALLRLGDGYW